MDYDLIVAGGGLAGATLGSIMAGQGHRVLVLEREARFSDRVRGEQMHPWGVAAARALGIYEPLVHAGGHQTRLWAVYAGGQPWPPRDLEVTTPHGIGSFHFYHPDMQEALLQRAEKSGAEIRRAARVESVRAGDVPVVEFLHAGRNHRATAGVVVGADGRGSAVRRAAGFELRRDPENLMIAGTLLDGSSVPDDGVYAALGEGR